MKPKRQPSWEDLRILLEISRHGSLHAAAKKIGVDHATVCRHLARAEAAFGIKLVDRTRNGISVRPDAVELLRHIEHMELHAQMLFDGAEASQDKLKIVRLASMEGLATTFIAPRMPLLGQAHPNIRLELVSTPFAVDIGKRESDLFLSFFQPPSPLLRSAKIGKFALHLYCSKAYAERRGVPKSRNDLDSHDYVGYVKDLLAIEAVRWIDELVPSPHMTFNSNSILAQRAAALAGLGIVMLPSFVAQGIADLHVILPDECVVTRDVWLSLAVDPDYLSPIRAVAMFVKEIFHAEQESLMLPAKSMS